MLRHRPKSSTRSVLDDTYLGQADDNRWSERGVPAYYFASDIGLVAAEHARHIAIDLPAGNVERSEPSVFKVPVSLDVVLRLTDPTVVEAMGADPIETWILDLAKTPGSGCLPPDSGSRAAGPDRSVCGVSKSTRSPQRRRLSRRHRSCAGVRAPRPRARPHDRLARNLNGSGVDDPSRDRAAPATVAASEDAA